MYLRRVTVVVHEVSIGPSKNERGTGNTKNLLASMRPRSTSACRVGRKRRALKAVLFESTRVDFAQRIDV